ncbi:MAG: nucleoside-diphosphate kinase [Euryarchaeota archaeon]|nr:nucleoside-diphosphate kinase [Euryarchaeota archaeon]
MNERTFVMIKPDGVAKDCIGEIIKRFEQNGFKILAMRMEKLTREKAEELYSPHKGKQFFNELVGFATSGPVVLMIIGGDNAVIRTREIIGATDPKKATKGTIRGDFGTSITHNVIHAADSKENARREGKLFFNEYF